MRSLRITTWLFVWHLIAPLAGYGQPKTTWFGMLDFDSPDGNPSSPPNYGIWIDSVASHGWQIGTPVKPVFNMSHSPTRVLATDTAGAYLPNDTAVFLMKQLASSGWAWPQVVSLEGWYWVHSDSLTDYGIIEVSPDNGKTWIDFNKDTSYNIYCSWTERPVFTGSSNGWKHFGACLSNIAQYFNVDIDDTVQFRFTFISDSVHTAKDGLMFDDLTFEDWASGIEGPSPKTFNSTPFPNPAAGTLHIRLSSPQKDTWQGTIWDAYGSLVMRIPPAHRTLLEVPVTDLPPGIYQYRIEGVGSGLISSGRFATAP